MKWISLAAISFGVYTTATMAPVAAQAHIRCQNTIGGPCGDSSRPREMNCCDYGYCQPWNSAYYQCLDKPAKCQTQETDMDYTGNDIKTIIGVLPWDCCDACAKTQGCAAYTFVNQNDDGKTRCYLKTSASGRREKKGAVSAQLTDVPPPPACPKQEKNIDFSGNDLKRVEGLTNAQCCDECGKTDKCAAYSYVETDWNGKSGCYLKTSSAGRRAKDGVVSAELLVAPPPDKCPKQEKNVDYVGNDLKTVRDVSNGQCCDECAKTNGCAAYTWLARDWDGKSSCFLKWSAAGRRDQSGVISGQLKDVPPPEKCPTQEKDVDFFGNDLKKIDDVSNAQCCDACNKLQGCVGYSFVDGSKPVCYLKNSLAGRVAKTGVISAAISCPNKLYDACKAAGTDVAQCCPSGAYCQPWNPGYSQCIPKPDAAKCPTILENVDFYGDNLDIKYGLAPAACCDACALNVDCRFFTFVNYNPDGKTACYLKKTFTEKRAKAGAVSGARYAS